MRFLPYSLQSELVYEMFKNIREHSFDVQFVFVLESICRVEGGIPQFPGLLPIRPSFHSGWPKRPWSTIPGGDFSRSTSFHVWGRPAAMAGLFRPLKFPGIFGINPWGFAYNTA